MNPFEPRPAPEPESPRTPVAQPPMMPSPAEPAGADNDAQPTTAEPVRPAQAWSPQLEPASPTAEEGPPEAEQPPAPEPPSADLSTAETGLEPASPTVEEQYAGEVAEPAEELEEARTSELPTMAQLDALSAELDDIDAVLAHMDGPAEQQPAS